MYNVRVKRFLDSVQLHYWEHPVFEHQEVKFSEVTGEIYERKRSDGLVEIWNPFTEEWERVKDLSDEQRIRKNISDSQNRSINVIWDIARSNRWEWFLTFTFSPEFSDRYDYSVCSGRLSKWLNNMKSRGCPDMKYLVVPEQHKDGAWHFHGLFAHCSEMSFESSGKYDASGKLIYNVGRYNWGFTTATCVTDTGKASGYLTKYVTKELVSATPGKKRYWASRNCARPVVEDFLISGSIYDFLDISDETVKSIKKVSTPFNHVTYIEL